MRLKAIDLVRAVRGPDGVPNEFFAEERGYDLASDDNGVWIRKRETGRVKFVSWSWGIACTPYEDDASSAFAKRGRPKAVEPAA